MLQHVHVQPLDLPLLIDPALLGSIWEIRIGGKFDTLHFPCGGSLGRLKPPKIACGRDVAPSLRERRWGDFYYQGDLQQIEVHGVAFVRSLEDCSIGEDAGTKDRQLDQQDENRLREERLHWFERWVRWVEALTSQSMHLHNPGFETLSRPSRSPVTWVIGERGPTNERTSGSIDITVGNNETIDSERGLNRETFCHAVKKSNVKEDVPTNLELRSSAHIACRRGGTRLSTIEAGIAAESWLTQLSGLPEAHGKSLGKLVTEALSIGISIPQTSEVEMVQPRNDAVHRGLHADMPTARRTLEIIEDIFALADPSTAGIISGMRRTRRPQRQDSVMFR